VHELLPAARWDRTAESIYFGPNTRLVRRAGSGSASALREAVQLADLDSATHAFIHLDDHVYCPGVRKLLEYGVDALQRDADLLWVRFSGYPVIYNERKPLEVRENCVAFDTVNLNPTRRDEYTLWWSSLDAEIIRGRYWPVAMWFCIYRLPVLAELLDRAILAGARHLAHVELHFRKEAGFEYLRTAYPNGRFGYVNMQYGGIEMHRNRNWRHLLELPNQPLR
jgi:hypothetical protein